MTWPWGQPRLRNRKKSSPFFTCGSPGFYLIRTLRKTARGFNFSSTAGSIDLKAFPGNRQRLEDAPSVCISIKTKLIKTVTPVATPPTVFLPETLIVFNSTNRGIGRVGPNSTHQIHSGIICNIITRMKQSLFL